MKLKPFKAIIFDLGGVILNLDYNATINAFKELGQENFDQLYTQAAQDRVFDQFECGEISAREFREYFRKTLKTNLTDEEIDKAWNALLLDLPTERIQLLKKLKESYPIFLFSNTNEIHLKAFRKIIGDSHGDPDLLEKVFHQTYYSHLVGKRKPDAEAFEHVLQEQGLNASKTLFIDDSIQHILGAQRLGIQAYHLQNESILELFDQKM